MEIKLKVYEDNGEVSKEFTAQSVDIMFGTIRRLMKLFSVDELENTAQIFKIVGGAWSDVTAILSEGVPEITDEDWDHVKLKELVPVIIEILKASFAEILTIPKDPKATGE